MSNRLEEEMSIRLEKDTEVARKCLLFYLQSWGQTVQQRVDALNVTVAAAGIKAKFSQGPSG